MFILYTKNVKNVYRFCHTKQNREKFSILFLERKDFYENKKTIWYYSCNFINY